MKYSLVLIGVIVLIALSSVSAQTPDGPECTDCELNKCPPPGNCPAGTARDYCGCCEVCALEEGQLCNYSPAKDGVIWHGFCGLGMKCARRTDISSIGLETQSVCECPHKELICGSDGVTYSRCQFTVAQFKNNITVKFEQPCQTRPKILSYSESVEVLSGTKHTILCEVQGFPLPTVQWYFTAPQSTEAQHLPGDSEEISISVRGGPEKMRITTYLQITDFQYKHEGFYECVASAVDGIDSKKMRLTVKTEKRSPEL